MDCSQDKQKEIEFFDRHATEQLYDVFTPASNARLIDAFKRLSGLSAGARVGDLGCGSGVFTACLQAAGYHVCGLDISQKLIAVGRERYRDLELVAGDAEQLPYPTESFDGILLSGLVHHLPDPGRCATEVYRVLRQGGRFVAFDPNRLNPFMWLYRDRASPFHSSVGVTENERPVLAHQVANTFRAAGFEVSTDYLSGLSYQYVASTLARRVLPIYNAIDSLMFAPGIMRPFRAFVLTYGEKG